MKFKTKSSTLKYRENYDIPIVNKGKKSIFFSGDCSSQNILYKCTYIINVDKFISDNMKDTFFKSCFFKLKVVQVEKRMEIQDECASDIIDRKIRGISDSTYCHWEG